MTPEAEELGKFRENLNEKLERKDTKIKELEAVLQKEKDVHASKMETFKTGLEKRLGAELDTEKEK